MIGACFKFLAGRFTGQGDLGVRVGWDDDVPLESAILNAPIADDGPVHGIQRKRIKLLTEPIG